MERPGLRRAPEASGKSTQHKPDSVFSLRQGHEVPTLRSAATTREVDLPVPAEAKEVR